MNMKMTKRKGNEIAEYKKRQNNAIRRI